MQLESERPRRTAVALDPHPLCHTALAAMLAPFDIDIVGAATSTCTAVALLQEHRPDLLVAEVELPEGRDAALRVISDGKRDDPGLTVIVLSGTDERTLIDAAFDHGASAYVLKTSDPEAIATAVRQAFEPSLYLARPQGLAATRVAPQLLRRLTRRELEILRLVSEGRSNRQVAEILWVTDQTVKFHLANVYRKLGVRSRFDAARWARENGIVDVVSRAVTAVSNGDENGSSTGGAKLVSLRRPVARANVTERLEETSR